MSRLEKQDLNTHSSNSTTTVLRLQERRFAAAMVVDTWSIVGRRACSDRYIRKAISWFEDRSSSITIAHIFIISTRVHTFASTALTCMCTTSVLSCYTASVLSSATQSNFALLLVRPKMVLLSSNIIPAAPVKEFSTAYDATFDYFMDDSAMDASADLNSNFFERLLGSNAGTATWQMPLDAQDTSGSGPLAYVPTGNFANAQASQYLVLTDFSHSFEAPTTGALTQIVGDVNALPRNDQADGSFIPATALRLDSPTLSTPSTIRTFASETDFLVTPPHLNALSLPHVPSVAPQQGGDSAKVTGLGLSGMSADFPRIAGYTGSAVNQPEVAAGNAAQLALSTSTGDSGSSANAATWNHDYGQIAAYFNAHPNELQRLLASTEAAPTAINQGFNAHESHSQASSRRKVQLEGSQSTPSIAAAPAAPTVQRPVIQGWTGTASNARTRISASQSAPAIVSNAQVAITVEQAPAANQGLIPVPQAPSLGLGQPQPMPAPAIASNAPTTATVEQAPATNQGPVAIPATPQELPRDQQGSAFFNVATKHDGPGWPWPAETSVMQPFMMTAAEKPLYNHDQVEYERMLERAKAYYGGNPIELDICRPPSPTEQESVAGYSPKKPMSKSMAKSKYKHVKEKRWVPAMHECKRPWSHLFPFPMHQSDVKEYPELFPQPDKHSMKYSLPREDEKM